MLTEKLRAVVMSTFEYQDWVQEFMDAYQVRYFTSHEQDSQWPKNSPLLPVVVGCLFYRIPLGTICSIPSTCNEKKCVMFQKWECLEADGETRVFFDARRNIYLRTKREAKQPQPFVRSSKTTRQAKQPRSSARSSKQTQAQAEEDSHSVDTDVTWALGQSPPKKLRKNSA